MQDKLIAGGLYAGALAAAAAVAERGDVFGRFTGRLYLGWAEPGVLGELLFEEEFDNVVCTIGKNLALNTLFAGSAYSVTGPFMGLISSTSFTAVAAGDTMASHAGWLEAGGSNAPTYSGNRPTAAFAAASGGSISLTAGLAFTFTGSGTVQGGFITLGTGAVTTKDNTSGTLWSAGTLGTAQPVISGNVFTMSYTASM